MEQVRRAKLVATLGPATDGLELDLVRAGLDVARLNFSHGRAADHARRCAAVREAARVIGRSVAVMQDLQGPKIRVGMLEATAIVGVTRTELTAELLSRGRTKVPTFAFSLEISRQIPHQLRQVPHPRPHLTRR